MVNIFGKIKDRARHFAGRMDQYQEAITYAQAGQQTQLQAVFGPAEHAADTSGRLLVMGRESSFSPKIVDYALEMAQRMSYEILALSTAPLSCDTFRLFSASQNKLCEQFESLARENVTEFQRAAQKTGIHFTHLIRFSEPDQALEEVQQEYADIEFVISDVQPSEAVDRIAKDNRPRREVFVYSMH
jgi:hypothetical protein